MDFHGLKGLFPLASILPSDIDFIVERNGRFLIGEIKLQGTPIPAGQQILFDNLLRQLPDVWMFEAEHTCSTEEIIQVHLASVVRCRSRKANRTYEVGTVSVGKLCQLWSSSFQTPRI